MSNDFEDGFEFSDDENLITQPRGGGNQRINMSGRAGEATSSAVPDPNQSVERPQSRRNTQVQKRQPPSRQRGYMPQNVEQIVPDTVEVNIDEDELTRVKPPKKKGGFLKVLVILIIIAVAGIIGAKFFLANRQEPQHIEYKGSGREMYDNLQKALQNYKAENLDAIIGNKDGDSYLAQEWAYANSNPDREKFILLTTSKVSFKYPKVEQKDTKGGTMLGSDGKPIMIESFMNDGEEVEVSVVDYKAIGNKIQTDLETIETMMVAKGIDKENYDYQNECIDLLMQYILQQPKLPMTTKKFRLSVSGEKFKDDIELDKILFSSDDFHYMSDEFDKVVK